MNDYSGRRLFNSWYIPDFNKPIGVGGFGAVYELKSYIIKDDTAAVKIISIPKDQNEYNSSLHTLGASEETVKRDYEAAKDALIQEIEMMRKVGCYPNCVGCMNYGAIDHEDGFGWDILIQMEKLESLDSYFRNKGDVYDADIIKLGIDICKALEVCNQFNIVHRDIKPANIMVMNMPGNEAIFKLGDFGVARVLSDRKTMSMSGTPEYMAPELLMGIGDSRVDIYSLGIVMYQLLNANRLPFMPDYPSTISMEEMNKARQSVMKGDPKPDPLYAIGTDLAKVVLKACEHDMDKRYSSAKEMREALEKILTDKQGNKEQRLIFTSIPVGGVCTPTELNTIVKIKGNCQNVSYDGYEHKVEGFTYSVINSGRKPVEVRLAPYAKAMAKGTQPGKYHMGLTRGSFNVRALNEGQKIANVIVEDGELVVEDSKIKEPEPNVFVKINGNRQTIRYDGDEHKVEGFTYSIIDSGRKPVEVRLAPYAKAIAKGTQPGKYPMGLTNDSFDVRTLDDGRKIANVIVEDGELVVEKTAEELHASQTSTNHKESTTYNCETIKPEKRIKLTNKMLIVLGAVIAAIIVVNSVMRSSETDVPSTTTKSVTESSSSTSTKKTESTKSSTTSQSTPTVMPTISPTSTPTTKAVGSPSDADLQAVGVTANIRYPKNTSYLSEYQYGYINAPSGNSVYGFKYSRPSDGSTIVCYPKDGESVTILAHQYYRVCVILDSSKTACWVNEDYIEYK